MLNDAVSTAEDSCRGTGVTEDITKTSIPPETWAGPATKRTAVTPASSDSVSCAWATDRDQTGNVRRQHISY